jgi:hypothetical protein
MSVDFLVFHSQRYSMKFVVSEGYCHSELQKTTVDGRNANLVYPSIPVTAKMFKAGMLSRAKLQNANRAARMWRNETYKAEDRLILLLGEERFLQEMGQCRK